MKAKYVGDEEDRFFGMIRNKVYEVLSIEYGFYRVIDESGEDYLYPEEVFEVVDDSDIDKIPKVGD